MHCSLTCSDRVFQYNATCSVAPILHFYHFNSARTPILEALYVCLYDIEKQQTQRHFFTMFMGKSHWGNLGNLDGVEGIRSQCVHRARVHGHAKAEVLF